jgi:hypothetical protein
MGGLIVKRILANLAVASSPERARIKAVFLIATPNRGAQIVNLAKLLQSRNPQFGDMSAEANRYLEAVDNLWTTMMISRKIQNPWPRSFCAFETMPTFGLEIVPEISSQTRCDNAPYPLPFDHLGVVKPVGRQFPPYPWTRYNIVATEAGVGNPVLSIAQESSESHIESASVVQQTTVGQVTFVVLGTKDTAFTTSSACRGCVVSPTLPDVYELRMSAPGDLMLSKPELACVSGGCKDATNYGVTLLSAKTVAGRFRATGNPSTWMMRAALIGRQETLTTTQLPPRTLKTGDVFTVVFPVNARGVRLMFESNAGVLNVDPTNLTGREPVDLVSWTVSEEGNRVYSLRFTGNWPPTAF